MAAGAKWSDRKSTRLNSSHTEIYTLSLHDALPISLLRLAEIQMSQKKPQLAIPYYQRIYVMYGRWREVVRSEEHTSELQSHRDLHSFPTRRSSDLLAAARRNPDEPEKAAARDSLLPAHLRDVWPLARSG